MARDGAALAYRLYPGGATRVAILAHGSSASSLEMHAVAKALASAGVTAVAPDIRGHGGSGARGDIGYIGQLEDDLADLLAKLRVDYPQARFELIGHSLGGGFVSRIAGSPLAANFDRFVLLAPYLGRMAPTNLPNEGKGRWVAVDVPRLLALALLRKIGVTFGESLPVIAYANDPAAHSATSLYSYRLLADYRPNDDFAATETSIRALNDKVVVIAGADDELMDAAAYVRTLKPLGADVTVLPGVDHMGVVTAPAALAAIVAAAKRGDPLHAASLAAGRE